MKKALPIILTLLFTSLVFSQKPCDANPKHSEFDYWIGEWEVYDLKGNIAGYSKVSKILDNCVLLEEWTSNGTQQGLVFSGKSFNSYNANTKQWQQNWVDNTGGSNEYLTGYFENNAMYFKSRSFIINGKKSVRSITFFKLPNGNVRQLGKISNDEEKTWVTEYDLEYRNKNK
jgi:hypothetical protein